MLSRKIFGGLFFKQKLLFATIDFSSILLVLCICNSIFLNFSFKQSLSSELLWAHPFTVILLSYIFGVYKFLEIKSSKELVKLNIIAVTTSFIILLTIAIIPKSYSISGFFNFKSYVPSLTISLCITFFLRYLYLRYFNYLNKKLKLFFILEPKYKDLVTKTIQKYRISSEYQILLFSEFSKLKIETKNQLLILGIDDKKDATTFLTKYKFIQNYSVISISSFFQEYWRILPFQLSEINQLLDIRRTTYSQINKRLKRLMDIICSVLGIIILTPLALSIYILIKISSTSDKVIFAQKRLGKSLKPFTLYKFRTMDKGNITKIGKILRPLRLDEIPQLLNIMNGSMSFVGPRPETDAYLNSFKESIPGFPLRNLIKPGLTGWAQVSLAYGIGESYSKDKLGYDLFYIKNSSLTFDIIILIKTIKSVLGATGK